MKGITIILIDALFRFAVSEELEASFPVYKKKGIPKDVFQKQKHALPKEFQLKVNFRASSIYITAPDFKTINETKSAEDIKILPKSNFL